MEKTPVYQTMVMLMFPNVPDLARIYEQEHVVYCYYAAPPFIKISTSQPDKPDRSKHYIYLRNKAIS